MNDITRAAEVETVCAIIEREKAMEIDYENLFKRLLMLNQMGVYLNGRDGHIWINQDENEEYPMKLDIVFLNTKIYGGIIEALDTIDLALETDGQPQLLERWEKYGKDVQFLGRGGVGAGRIDIVKAGQGGLN